MKNLYLHFKYSVEYFNHLILRIRFLAFLIFRPYFILNNPEKFGPVVQTGDEYSSSYGRYRPTKLVIKGFYGLLADVEYNKVIELYDQPRLVKINNNLQI